LNHGSCLVCYNKWRQLCSTEPDGKGFRMLPILGVWARWSCGFTENMEDPFAGAFPRYFLPLAGGIRFIRGFSHDPANVKRDHNCCELMWLWFLNGFMLIAKITQELSCWQVRSAKTRRQPARQCYPRRGVVRQRQLHAGKECLLVSEGLSIGRAVGAGEIGGNGTADHMAKFYEGC